MLHTFNTCRIITLLEVTQWGNPGPLATNGFLFSRSTEAGTRSLFTLSPLQNTLQVITVQL